MKKTLPEVKVKLLRTEKGNYFIIERCPFCTCPHWHGAAVVGPRIPHCYDSTLEAVGKTRDEITQYVVVWDDNSKITSREAHALKRASSRRLLGHARE